MNKLVGSRIISYNKITGDVVVGTFTGITSMHKSNKMYVLSERPTFFVLNKSKTKHQSISLDVNTWLLLKFTPQNTKLLSRMRKAMRLYKRMYQQNELLKATIAKAKQNARTNIAHSRSRTR